MTKKAPLDPTPDHSISMERIESMLNDKIVARNAQLVQAFLSTLDSTAEQDMLALLNLMWDGFGEQYANDPAFTEEVDRIVRAAEEAIFQGKETAPARQLLSMAAAGILIAMVDLHQVEAIYRTLGEQ